MVGLDAERQGASSDPPALQAPSFLAERTCPGWLAALFGLSFRGGRGRPLGSYRDDVGMGL